MIRALGLVIALLLAALVLQTKRLQDARIAVASMAAEIQSLRADNAEARVAAESAARTVEHNLWAAAIAAEAKYQEGIQHAKSAADRVVADLRAGTVRLRSEWAGCETSRLSQGAAAAIELGQAERRRHESAGRIVRAVDECAAQVSALIGDAQAVRAAINAGVDR